jgi:uncharacterized protein with HEPN domain
MPSETAKAALYAIRDNIRLAKGLVEGSTYEQFRISPLHVYGVTRALEIISEASRRLPEDLRERHPKLPWRSIRDVGNFYRHEYDPGLVSLGHSPRSSFGAWVCDRDRDCND